MGTKSSYELIIIGCGIAGASLAYFLTEQGMIDILILEKEEQPGYHATGRAAAVLVEFDFIPSVLQLKMLSAGFLRRPPDGFSENPVLRQSRILIMFQGSLWELAQQIVSELRQAGTVVNVLSQQEVVSMVPVVSYENFDGALFFTPSRRSRQSTTPPPTPTMSKAIACSSKPLSARGDRK